MKEHIQNIHTGLLVVIALTVIYGTFIKDSGQTTKRERVTRQHNPNRKSNIAATPPNKAPKPYQPTNQPVNDPTTITFEKMKHDFGNIKQNSVNEVEFKFTNTGNKPLIIESATGSCGCTVPEYPKEPIPPGKTGSIKVVYKPGKQKGLQNKNVTVIANTQPKDTRLLLSANVKEE